MSGGRRVPDLARQPVVDRRASEWERRHRRRHWTAYRLVMALSIASGVVGAWGLATQRGPGAFGFGWFVLIGLVGTLLARRRLRPRLQDVARHPILQECPDCGYATISPDDGRCPECGAIGTRPEDRSDDVAVTDDGGADAGSTTPSQ